MLSLAVLICLLLIHQPSPTYQFETIQAALASTVELPCSVDRNIEPTNLAKVSAGRDKCLYVLSRVCCSWDARVLFKERKESESKVQGVDKNDDIMSNTQLANVYTYSLIVAQHEIFADLLFHLSNHIFFCSCLGI